MTTPTPRYLQIGGDNWQEQKKKDVKAESISWNHSSQDTQRTSAFKTINNSRGHWKREGNKASKGLIFVNICNTLHSACSRQLHLSRHCSQGCPTKQQQTRLELGRVSMNSSEQVSELCLTLCCGTKETDTHAHYLEYSLLVISMNTGTGRSEQSCSKPAFTFPLLLLEVWQPNTSNATGQGATGTNWSRVLSEDEEELLPSEGDGALAQAAQGGCGVSFSGDIPDLPGHGPLQPALGDPASAEGLDDPQRSLPTLTILWFCKTKRRQQSAGCSHSFSLPQILRGYYVFFKYHGRRRRQSHFIKAEGDGSRRSLGQQIQYITWVPKNQALRFYIFCLSVEAGRSTRGQKTKPTARPFGYMFLSHTH